MGENEGKPTEFKTIGACPEVKLTEDGEDQGLVEHLISVYGVLDLGRDICQPGAFTKTLQERKDQVRVVDSHQRGSILNVLGFPVDIWEVDRNGLPQEVRDRYPEASGGVKALTQFLLDTPEGAGAYKRIKSGAINDFSFGYDTLDSDRTKGRDGKSVRNLRTLRLWEYGPAVIGMNPATCTTDVKSTEETFEIKVVDVGENTIRIRVKPSGSFQEGTFRTITVGKASEGIKAVIGKLKGETTTTIQSYLFDKKKWTKDKAVAWVKEHGKKKSASLTQLLRDVRAAFNVAHNPDDSPSRYWVKEVFEDFLVVEDEQSKGGYFKVDFTAQDDSFTFSERDDWVAGKYTFVTSESSEEPEQEQQETDGQGDQEKMLLMLVEIEQEQLEIERMRAGPA